MSATCSECYEAHVRPARPGGLLEVHLCPRHAAVEALEEALRLVQPIIDGLPNKRVGILPHVVSQALAAARQTGERT